MESIGEIKYEIKWKWWTAPIFLVSELPFLRNWSWLQKVSYELVMNYGFELEGPSE